MKQPVISLPGWCRWNSLGDADEIGYSNGSSGFDITFDSDVTSVNIEFAWLNSVETASYDFYLDGESVGSGSTDGITDYIDPVVNLKPVTEGQLFDEIRFYSTSSTDDYLIHSISFERQVNTTTPIVVEELSSISMGFNSALTDTDLSESLSVVLQDIPVGFTISDGIRTFTADADTTSVNVTHWNMSDISIQVSAVDTDTNYTMLLVSTATEVSNGDTAETSQEINITVKDNPDLLFLNNNSAEVYESAMSGGISEASDGEVVSGNILTDDILPDGAALTDVTINGGSTSISGNAITVTTAEGNVLIVNSVTGDYTYTLVNDVNHANIVIGEVPDSEISEIDAFTENWNTNGSILNGSMNLEQADTASKTFSFGVGHAGQTVTISYVVDISSGYDANGRYQDYFIVTANGEELSTSTAGANQTYELTAQLDGNGDLAVLIDNNSTYFNETVSIESFTITGTDNEVVYDNADTVQDIFTYTVTDDVGQHFTAELDVTIYDSTVIAGSSGDDSLIGTNGNDSIVGGAGSDIY